MVFFVILVAIYAFYAFCLQRVAEKLNAQNTWLAWIPIANLFLMCSMAGRPAWWVILLFIPIVSIIICVIVWMDICGRLGKPRWLGVAMLFVGVIILPYLAFAD
jgi:hypothetical protein